MQYSEIQFFSYKEIKSKKNKDIKKPNLLPEKQEELMVYNSLSLLLNMYSLHEIELASSPSICSVLIRRVVVAQLYRACRMLSKDERAI